MASMVPKRSGGGSMFDPFRQFESLQDQMNQLFNMTVGRWGNQAAEKMLGTWSPNVDVIDAKDKLEIKAELPGLKKDEIRVSVEDSTLVISGEKKESTEKRENDFLQKESFYGSFSRSIPLPEGVDPSKIDASYHDGVLNLNIPKSQQARPKQIPVNIK